LPAANIGEWARGTFRRLGRFEPMADASNVRQNGGCSMSRLLLSATAAAVICISCGPALATESGAIGGGIAGAVGGAAVGGPVGAIVGGVGGAAIGNSMTNHRYYHHHYAYYHHRHYHPYYRY
jgi:ribosomal protein S27E